MHICPNRFLKQAQKYHFMKQAEKNKMENLSKTCFWRRLICHLNRVDTDVTALIPNGRYWRIRKRLEVEGRGNVKTFFSKRVQEKHILGEMFSGRKH